VLQRFPVNKQRSLARVPVLTEATKDGLDPAQLSQGELGGRLQRTPVIDSFGPSPKTVLDG